VAPSSSIRYFLSLHSFNPLLSQLPGGPHVISQDEILDDHFIKKGTICLGNIWFVFGFYDLRGIANWTIRNLMHDEKYFSDPHEFIPERHLKAGNETGAAALLDPTA
jgi:hypothetical protein